MTVEPRGWTRWLPWVLLVAVLAGALVFGTRQRSEPTLTERTLTVAATLRCPECTDKSMAASDAPTSVAGRTEIRRQLAAGKSPDEVRAWFASRYDQTILLTPERKGIDGLIWALPVVVFVVAAAALAAVFVRWRRRGDLTVSDADREMVDAARAEVESDGDDRDGGTR
jgi:cytochrome c-type biogenesis protein CcmH/NrfF